jgi:hypothetical protein
LRRRFLRRPANVPTLPIPGPVIPLIVDPATLLPPKHAGGSAPKDPVVLISVTEDMYIGNVAGLSICSVPASA